MLLSVNIRILKGGNMMHESSSDRKEIIFTYNSNKKHVDKYLAETFYESLKDIVNQDSPSALFNGFSSLVKYYELDSNFKQTSPYII